ncbi:aldo/keto reductase [Ruania rhizosphaerae]|uniref:aldo/keto reductase n=1 Tax=Ruania rhizosphaerae TaxID=1840413 RepID=UPI001358D2FF|nr:aldo/keto reductase [Ruania rhizosphaerae]
MQRQQQQVILGSSGLSATRLGLGGGPLGNMFAPIGEDDARAALERAWDLGVRLYDTSPFYGYGTSERRFGRMLADKPREEFVLSTKVGKMLRADVEPKAEQFVDGEPFFRDVPALNVEYDYSGDGVRRSIEQSLERLGLDRIDHVNVHDPDDFFEEAINGAIPALVQLRSEGVIGSVGIGINQADLLERFVREADLDLVLLAGRYSLLDQAALSTTLFEATQQTNTAIMLGGVYNSGLLVRPEVGARFNYEAAPTPLIDRAQALAAICDRHDVPLMAAAIQFPLAHPAITAVLTGVRAAVEIEENVRMLNHHIPAQLWADIRASGLVHEEAVLPDEAA